MPERRVGGPFDRDILDKVASYYTHQVVTHGPVPSGVDWNSRESQELRFEQLLRVCEGAVPFSINDYGCGYGALADFLQARSVSCRYCGFDVSEEMIRRARALHPGDGRCTWVTDAADLSPCDYTVASGILNVKLDVSDTEWREHMLLVIDALADLSTRGFAFNVLTKYSDAERMRPGLYYADPCFLFDHCQRRYSRWVSLLHDYGLYECTILVRLEGGTPWRG